MSHIYEIKRRTFAAKYATDAHEKAVMNGNVMTSEYGPRDKWAVLEDGEAVMLFGTEKEAREWLGKTIEIVE